MEPKDKPRCCESCGGLIGEDGFALEMPEHEEEESPAVEATEEMRSSAFADAMKRRHGGAS